MCNMNDMYINMSFTVPSFEMVYEAQAEKFHNPSLFILIILYERRRNQSKDMTFN